MLLTMPDLSDPRERAFAALVPLAPTVADVLSRVDVRTADDIARNAAARASWTPTQRKTSAGYVRFCDAIDGLKTGLEMAPSAVFTSTASQEASNLFFWQVDGWLTLRVKSEPTELAYEATEPLFARHESAADQTVCLSWTITPRSTIRDARFVSVHQHTPWSISLVELLAAPSDADDGSSGSVVPLRPRRPGGPSVSSNRPAHAADDADVPSSD